ncbi:NAD(P)H-hydrate epimerase [Candidatus Micrarchaeota archaeon]|nr:NAD(P)H-hydrate epimerase [Candidatus Micrarchaeota archaeon]MBU1165359.1 NAD(P)H-hydrate epimerase [Candidatus Micrarchaeota archaeon]MBU1886483.1 NAD(P)H-hydrate epimerase [Candidatus Micrarchaeota archaeon]
MHKAISVKKMRELEENAFANGTTVLELMERAGKACADMIKNKYSARNAIVFCGPGNNGGDGLVCARYLVDFGFGVSVILPIEPKTDATKTNYERAKSAGVVFVKLDDLQDNENRFYIVIDALLGIGAKGKLRGEIKKSCQLINSMSGFKISIDIPTGMNADTGECDPDYVEPDATIGIHAPKTGEIKAGKKKTGESWIVDIGLMSRRKR